MIYKSAMYVQQERKLFFGETICSNSISLRLCRLVWVIVYILIISMFKLELHEFISYIVTVRRFEWLGVSHFSVLGPLKLSMTVLADQF